MLTQKCYKILPKKFTKISTFKFISITNNDVKKYHKTYNNFIA